MDRLDVSILQNNLLSPILGVDDPTKSDRIEFIGGIRGIKELEKRANKDMKVNHNDNQIYYHLRYNIMILKFCVFFYWFFKIRVDKSKKIL